jgi:hypothetical protein
MKINIVKTSKEDLKKLAQKIRNGDFEFLVGDPNPDTAIEELGLDPNNFKKKGIKDENK